VLILYLYLEKKKNILQTKFCGSWAIITGASSGLGVEFAKQIAATGINVILTARREDRLKQLADELSKKYGVATRVITADLGTQNGYEKLITGVQDLQISILINNAGMGYLGEFTEQNSEKLAQLLNLNCYSPTLLTLKLLNSMKKARKGIIIFVSSLSQFQPLPYHAVYGGTKSYISSFFSSNSR